MTELRSYQLDAIKAMDAADGRAIFAYAPGTGKTATTVRWLEDYNRILVVAPNGPVLTHWATEADEWAGLLLAHGTGSPKKRARVRDSLSLGNGLIVNYETMRGDIDELIKIPWDAVVFDESHRLKNRKSLTYKAAKKLAGGVDRVMLVTGTPILNAAEELWASLSILEPKVYRSFWRWAEMHFHIVYNRRGRFMVREICKASWCGKCKGRGLLPGHAKMLRHELGVRLIQKPLEELLPDMPPVTETYLTVQLSPAERRSYDSMLKDAWMILGDELVVAINDVSKQTRLRQLASDWSAFGETTLGAKGKAAVDLVVEDMESEQVVIFAAFRETVTTLCREIPKSVEYHGGLTRLERDQAIQRFITGEARVLVGTIGTMSEGIDGLQVARNVIFLDRDWTPARNEQAIARLQRSGQLSSVNVTHIVAENTVDDAVATALRRKRSVIEAVLGSGGRNAVHRP